MLTTDLLIYSNHTELAAIELAVSTVATVYTVDGKIEGQWRRRITSPPRLNVNLSEEDEEALHWSEVCERLTQVFEVIQSTLPLCDASYEVLVCAGNCEDSHFSRMLSIMPELLSKLVQNKCSLRIHVCPVQKEVHQGDVC